ncbi:MAG: LysM peptidoglycan-binding domain-containing protein [Phycisphaerae bacterium]|nr:LysM peptidoglycan-binding domain-containing protein [Phycisphaerae bacterium]
MTKETKIGLLVGMGVIILIGILISDHLSSSRQQSAVGSPLDPLGRAVGPRTPPRFLDPADAADSYRTTDVLPPPVYGTDLGRGAPSDLLPPATVRPIPLQPEPVVLKQELYPASSISNGNAGKSTEARDPGPAPVATTPPRLSSTPPGSAPSPGRRLAGSKAKGPVYHTVGEGESLSSIAELYYGDANQFQRVYEANRKVLPDADTLRAGVRLLIPDKKKPAAAAAPASRPPALSASASTGAAARPRVPMGSHTVGEGETLASIAEQHYGSQLQWNKLYQLNKDRIRNPDRIRVGLVLRVPR